MRLEAQGKVDTMAKLLFIDDDRAVLGMMRAYFSDREDEVLCAETSSEGLRLAFEERPDIVILDLGLPDGPGDEALRQIKTFLPEIKVVVVTGMTDDELRARVLEYGCDAYFRKTDLSLGQLEGTVRSLSAKNESS